MSKLLLLLIFDFLSQVGYFGSLKFVKHLLVVVQIVQVFFRDFNSLLLRRMQVRLQLLQLRLQSVQNSHWIILAF